MNTLHEIQNAVEKLSRDDLERFRAWFEEFDAHLWDAEIERVCGRANWIRWRCRH